MLNHSLPPRVPYWDVVLETEWRRLNCPLRRGKWGLMPYFGGAIFFAVYKRQDTPILLYFLLTVIMRRQWLHRDTCSGGRCTC